MVSHLFRAAFRKESFFLLPMLRRLEGVMAQMELQEEDKNSYRARKSVLEKEKKVSQGLVSGAVSVDLKGI